MITMASNWDQGIDINCNSFHSVNCTVHTLYHDCCSVRVNQSWTLASPCSPSKYLPSVTLSIQQRGLKLRMFTLWKSVCANVCLLLYVVPVPIKMLHYHQRFRCWSGGCKAATSLWFFVVHLEIKLFHSSVTVTCNLVSNHMLLCHQNGEKKSF